MPLVYHGPPVSYRGRADLLLEVTWPDDHDRQLVLVEVKVRERPHIYERDLLQLAAYTMAAIAGGCLCIDSAAILLVVPPAAELVEVPLDVLRICVQTWLAILGVYAGLAEIREVCRELSKDRPE